MGDKSKIEWTEATWNPVVGCTHVSPGCDNCYAASLASGRLAGTPTYAGLAEGGRFNGTVRLLPDRLGQPLSWRRPRRVFVNSMSDVFHEAVPDAFIAKMFAVMSATPRHTFQILSKRHGRLRSLMSSESFHQQVLDIEVWPNCSPLDIWPLPNVWLGVSVEDQKRADLRIPALLDTLAAVRFLSCEPLLGPIDLSRWLDTPPSCGCGIPPEGAPGASGCSAGCMDPAPSGIDWVIAGGESGRDARPMHPDWVRTLRDQCTAAGVAFFFKQWGEWAPTQVGVERPLQVGGDLYPHERERHVLDGMRRIGKKRAGRELDGRTHDEYPAAVTT